MDQFLKPVLDAFNELQEFEQNLENNISALTSEISTLELKRKGLLEIISHDNGDSQTLKELTVVEQQIENLKNQLLMKNDEKKNKGIELRRKVLDLRNQTVNTLSDQLNSLQSDSNDIHDHQIPMLDKQIGELREQRKGLNEIMMQIRSEINELNKLDIQTKI